MYNIWLNIIFFSAPRMRPQPGPKPDFLKPGSRIGQLGGNRISGGGAPPPPAKAWQGPPTAATEKSTGIPVKKFRDSVGLENENIRRGAKLDDHPHAESKERI